MSDLLAPILVVMENEVDAFWCFAGFMERVVSIHMLMDFTNIVGMLYGSMISNILNFSVTLL